MTKPTEEEQIAEDEHNGDEHEAGGELLAASSDQPLSRKRKAEALIDPADKVQ